MKTKHVRVLPYSPRWKEEFSKIRRELEQALSDCPGRALSNLHVGSTAVEGLAAKPVIDVDVVVRKGAFHAFPAVRESMEKAGYLYEGNLGIEGREAFRYEKKEYLMERHLYVCGEGSRELSRHPAFRDWLRTHPADRDAYGARKLEAARRPEDIGGYTEEKAPVIEEIYRRCGLAVQGGPQDGGRYGQRESCKPDE